MKLKISVLVTLLGMPTAEVLAQGIEMPQPQAGYSAVRTIEVAGNTMEGIVSSQGLKERSEMSMEGQSMISIVRQDLGVIWIVMPGGIYMEQPLDGDGAGPGSGGPPTRLSDAANVVEFVEEGTEQVNGVDTTRYRMRAENPDGSAVDGKLWLTDLNIPVRSLMVVQAQGRTDEITINLRDLEVGDQPASLFEVPDGYEQFSMPAMPGMPGANPFSR